MVSNLREKAKESLDNKTLDKLSEGQSLLVLNAILACYEHLECMDAIQETTYYRQSLKIKTKAVIGELEKQSMAIGDVIGIDNEALSNLMAHKKELITKIAKIRPEQKSGVNALLEAYLAAPELTLHRLGIKIIDRDL